MGSQGPTITVCPYDPARGAVADVDGGDVSVSIDTSGVLIAGNSAGLRGLARLCLVIADEGAPSGVHAHLDPNVTPLTGESLPVVIARL